MVAIVKSISESSEQRQARNSDKHTEDSLAALIELENQGDWFYSHMHGQWYIRDEAAGQYDEDRRERVLHLIRERLSELNVDNNAKLGSAATIAAVEKLARRGTLAIRGDELDAGPHLLGTPGGVVDLTTGAMIEELDGAIVTKRTAATPAAGKPTAWLAFINPKNRS